MQTQADLVQFGFAHDPRQAEQQPVVIGTRVVEALAVGEDHAKQRAQFEELMPIAVVARQSGGIQAAHEAGVAEPDLSDQPLETVPLGTLRPRFAEILVDDMDTLARPAEADGTVDEAILQFGAFLVLANLVDRGLPHIDVSELGAVRRAHPLVSAVRGAQHGRAPAPRCFPVPSAAAGRRQGGRSAFASRAAGSAKAATAVTQREHGGADAATDGERLAQVTSSTAVARRATI